LSYDSAVGTPRRDCCDHAGTKYGCDKRGDEVPEELRDARARVARIEEVLATVDENTKESLKISSTDLDARFMHCPMGSMPAFNGQVVVTEDQLIVDADVTTEPIDSNWGAPGRMDTRIGECSMKPEVTFGYREEAAEVLYA
jgi:hypothetical protein